MRWVPHFTLLALLSCGCAGGCNVPATLNLYAVDAITGRPVPNARVEQTNEHWVTWAVGATNSAGHLDGIQVHRNERLMLTGGGYEPMRVLIDFSGALPLPPVPPPPDDAARRADRPIVDADAFPYGADRLLTILLRPK